MDTIVGFNFRISKYSLRVPCAYACFFGVRVYATHIQVYRGRSLITVARPVHRKSFILYYYIVILVFSRLLSFPVVNYLFSTLRNGDVSWGFFLQNKRKTRTKKKNLQTLGVRKFGWKDDGWFRPFRAAVSSVRGFPSMERKKKRDCITDRVRYIIILIIQYTNIHTYTYMFPRIVRRRWIRW